jgi:hypothetical protein
MNSLSLDTIHTQKANISHSDGTFPYKKNQNSSIFLLGISNHTYTGSLHKKNHPDLLSSSLAHIHSVETKKPKA